MARENRKMQAQGREKTRRMEGKQKKEGDLGKENQLENLRINLV